jgi:hypothetical protein
MKAHLFFIFLFFSLLSFSQTIYDINKSSYEVEVMMQRLFLEYSKKFTNIVSEENIAALIGLDKLPNIETKLKDLGNSTLSILEKRKTQGISTLTSSEIKVIESSLKFMEENAAGNKTITKILNDLKLEVELLKLNSMLNSTTETLSVDSLLGSVDFLSKSLIQLNSKNKGNKELSELEKSLNDKKQELVQLKIDSYSSSYNVYDSTNTAVYLKENIDEVKKLALGNYDLIFDQKGNLITFKENNFKIIDSKAIKTITDKGINIPLPTKISFSVVSNDSILVSTNYYSSTTKDVFLNNTSKSYLFKETPSASKITITNDGSINKKQLKVVYQFKNEKLANGILLESTSYTKEEVKDILKK